MDQGLTGVVIEVMLALQEDLLIECGCTVRENRSGFYWCCNRGDVGATGRSPNRMWLHSEGD